MIRRKIAAFFVAMSMLTLFTGCNNLQGTKFIEQIQTQIQTQLQAQAQAQAQKEAELQATLDEIKDIFSDSEKIAAKYGAYSVASRVDNDIFDYHYDYYEMTDGDHYSCVTYGDGVTSIKFDGEYYSHIKTENGFAYSKFVNYDDKNRYLSEFEDFSITGAWLSDEASDSSIKECNDGYTIEYSYSSSEEEIGDYTCNATVSVNSDLSLKDIKCEYKTAADEVFCIETSTFCYGEDEPSFVTDCKAIIEEADGKTRNVIHHIIENGKVVATYSSYAPSGFYITALFPEEYVDASYKVFNDIECTQSASQGDSHTDSETYVLTDKEEARIANAVDYGSKENWAYYVENPTEKVDVFFIAPTVGKSETCNMSMDDEKYKSKLIGATNMEKGIYDEKTNFYSPYYKQASLEIYSLPEDEREQYLEIAYNDINDAFNYYMDNVNDGRPYIIAGFSQGSDLTKRLLENNENINDNMIAAYAIGWNFTEDDLEKYPNIKMAQGETDLGVVVSFCSEDVNYNGNNMIAPVKTLGINPLNWKTDSTVADKSLNEGACFTDYSGEIQTETKGLCGAYRDEERGTLKVTGISPKDYPAVLSFLEDGNYHLYDYQFFYRNLQENVNKRIEAFFENAK